MIKQSYRYPAAESSSDISFVMQSIEKERA
jgi:hypothetical protein